MRAVLARLLSSLGTGIRGIGRHRVRAAVGLIVPLVAVLVIGIDPSAREELVSGISGGIEEQSQLFGRRTRATPTPTARPEERVIAIAAGGQHSLAVKSDGSVWAWGNNTYGQLGDATFEWRREPTRVRGIRDATAVAAGASHSLALTRDGSVWAWGRNDRGQLGDGTTALRNQPVRLHEMPFGLNAMGAATAIEAGASFSLALAADGRVWAWGANEAGQLGDGTYRDRYLPVRTAGIKDVDRIAAGSFHAVALRADGTVWSWGRNDKGQLGDKTYDTRAEPVQVARFQEGWLAGIVGVAAGGLASAAVNGERVLLTWGDRSSGSDSARPISVTPPYEVESVALGGAGHPAGDGFTVAASRDGTVWSWGAPHNGALGRAEGDGSYRPAQIADLQLARQGGRLARRPVVAAGYGHAIALSDDGKVWAWGRNDSGQVGDGSTTQRSRPLALTSLTR